MSAEPSAPPSRQYLVTGAGSGIGLAVVQALATTGHRVWAGARRDEDLAHLAAIPNVEALPLDLLSPASVTAARDAIAANGGRLDGLVNSAGIGELGHLAAWRDDDVRRLFETNVFGLMRLTQALLPMLLAARGRVVNIGSMGGSITQPLYGPYTMSKFALEAYSECLRLEGAPHGLAVSIVQPGAVATRIGQSAAAGTRARLAATPAPFDADARRALQSLDAPPQAQPDAPESANNRRPASPESVAAVVVEALGCAAPRARYLVGTRWEGERVLDALTERLIDAATSPGQRLDRAALLARVDAAWRARGAEVD
ncbi:MAG: SDR family oxidoreductase [Rubrivivax sp.]|nr:SDR family oxidoreductase [Rubrivivax sp.]